MPAKSLTFSGSVMLASFLLGLLGSFGHCVGMCSAVVVLLGRQPSFRGNHLAWTFAHMGRILTYAMLGLAAGLLGQSLQLVSGGLPLLQGLLSILLGMLAFYMAFAFLGYARSPEILLAGLVSNWGRAMRGLRSPAPFAAGLLWGLLPCGLVLTALLPAMTSANAALGALHMTVFGIATLPSLLAVKWLAGGNISRTWSRGLASLLLMFFGFQFFMRGFASLNWVDHLMIGPVMLW